MIFPNLQLAVCQVAKAGSTYWREDVVPLVGGQMTQNFPQEQREQAWKHYKNVIFVRHPLNRLFSSYNDKMVGMAYAHAGKIGYLVDSIRSNKANKYDECYRDVTFEEFAKMVVFTIERSQADIHWKTMHDLCLPCQIKYDFIGHLETFVDDLEMLKTILPDKKYANNLTISLTKEAYVHDKCRQFTGWHLKPFAPQFGKSHCNEDRVILPAKLKAMNNKGFSTNLGFNFSSFINVPKAMWETKCKTLISGILNDKSKMKQVKERSHRIALKYLNGLSKQTLAAVVKAYNLDFEIFGYEPDVL